MKTVTVHRFADQLNQIIPVMMKEFARRQTNELYKGKISLPQFFVLNFLEKKNTSNMTELAHVMKITLAGMTGVIARLVRAGYVERLSDPEDRRIINVKLTPRGAKLVQKVNDERRRMIVQVFGKISPIEREQYLNILTKIKDILKVGND